MLAIRFLGLLLPDEGKQQSWVKTAKAHVHPGHPGLTVRQCAASRDRQRSRDGAQRCSYELNRNCAIASVPFTPADTQPVAATAVPHCATQIWGRTQVLYASVVEIRVSPNCISIATYVCMQMLTSAYSHAEAENSNMLFLKKEYFKLLQINK